MADRDIDGDPRLVGVLDADQHAFVAQRRRAILVTLSGRGDPRPVPICFVLAAVNDEAGGPLLYTPLDEKPKRSADVRQLARVRDIAARPDVTLLFEHWEEDWSQLAWLRARGRARLVEPQDDAEAHSWAVHALRERYPQYRTHRIEEAPMIRIAIGEAVSWSAASGLH